MEQMVLGSPTSPQTAGTAASPFGTPLSASHATPLGQRLPAGTNLAFGAQPSQPAPPTTTAAPFLPSYLLGYENSRPAPPSPSGRPTYPHPHSPCSSPHTKEFPPTIGAPPRFGRSDRPSGPPVAALSPHTPSRPDMLQRQQMRTPLGSPAPASRTPAPHTPTPLLNASIISSEVHDEVASTGGAQEWVTVFGFPVAAASLVLTQFAGLGTITQQRLPGSGNWMHLQYQSAMQARRALALNGKVIGGTIMIGVVTCTDRTVTEGAALPNPPPTPLTPKAALRSLTTPHLPTTPTEAQVVQTPKDTPTKDTSLLSRAVQRLIGV